MKRLIGFVAGILIPGLILAGGLSNPALAQAWPSKPIRIVIAQAPGSATDVISRVVGNQLSVSLGQPIVIDARPGARRADDARSGAAGFRNHFVVRIARARRNPKRHHRPAERGNGQGPGFAAHIKSEIARFTQIAKAAGIKAE